MDRTEQLRRAGAEEVGHVEQGARELLVGSLGADPWERIEELREAGRAKAEAEGLAYQMEKERKALLARLSSEYARTHSDKSLSEAKLDRLARSDERYQKHIKGTAAAVEKRELANSEYWGIRARLLWDEKAIAHLNAMSKLSEPG